MSVDTVSINTIRTLPPPLFGTDTGLGADGPILVLRAGPLGRRQLVASGNLSGPGDPKIL